jgi:NADP-dependent aldehyde dehydrogenase
MSSPNPVVLLPGVLEARGREVASELAESLMLASGQFCTKPGLLFVPTESSSAFEEDLVTALGEKAPSVLMGDSVLNQLRTSVEHLMAAGAELRHQSEDVAAGCGFPTTVLKVTARRFLSHSDQFREEAFGNVAVLVEWGNLAELTACLERLPGCLVGSIYCAEGPEDDSHIAEVLPVLLEKVGRLAENKATTGVAVVASMNHGGPFPASGHPGFTSVGIPETFNRFTMLQTFDNVRDEHLPPELQQSNPLGIDRVEIPPR